MLPPSVGLDTILSDSRGESGVLGCHILSWPLSLMEPAFCSSSRRFSRVSSSGLGAVYFSSCWRPIICCFMLFCLCSFILHWSRYSQFVGAICHQGLSMLWYIYLVFLASIFLWPCLPFVDGVSICPFWRFRLFPRRRRYRFLFLAYSMKLLTVSVFCSFCAHVVSDYFPGALSCMAFLASDSSSWPSCPFVSARHNIICRLHVLYRISLTSPHRCRRPSSVCPLFGA